MKKVQVIKLVNYSLSIFLGLIIIYLIYFQIQIRRNPNKALNSMNLIPISILSGSMRPNFNPGDMIIVKKVPPENVGKNEIITFKSKESVLVTHRVVEILKDNRGLMFKTRGDGNNSDDVDLVKFDQLVGVYVFKIPYGGYVANFINSKFGFIVVVCVPIIILIFNEIIGLLKQKMHKDSTN